MTSKSQRSPTEVVAEYMSELLDPSTPVADPVPVATPRAEAGYYMCYLFGLEIGIPADRICADAPMPSRVRSGRLRGVLEVDRAGGAFNLIDLARLILPEDMPNLDLPVEERADHVILLDEGEWAVVAESPSEFVDIAGEDIIWKGSRGRSRWLAGVIPSRRSVLIDPDGLLEVAESGKISS